MPRTNKIVPTVCRLTPLTCAVTAHLRIAPTAIRTIEVPIVISGVYPVNREPTRRYLPPRLAQLTLHVSGDIAVSDRLALVEEVLTLRQRDLNFGSRPRTGEVHPRRHQGQATFLGSADQPLDLEAMQQQLSRSLGVVVLARRGTVRRDVGADQPHLAVADRRVGVLELS